jgi:hypothetical protein
LAIGGTGREGGTHVFSKDDTKDFEAREWIGRISVPNVFMETASSVVIHIGVGISEDQASVVETLPPIGNSVAIKVARKRVGDGSCAGGSVTVKTRAKKTAVLSGDGR